MKAKNYVFCKDCGIEQVFDMGDVPNSPDVKQLNKAVDFAKKHSTHNQVSMTIMYSSPEDIKAFLDKKVITEYVLEKMSE
ncbi:MAG: hypothetical protein QXH07_02360 [Thermoplasmata archaeon]